MFSGFFVFLIVVVCGWCVICIGWSSLCVGCCVFGCGLFE